MKNDGNDLIEEITDRWIPLVLSIGGILAFFGAICVLLGCAAEYTQNSAGDVHFRGTVAEPETIEGK